MTSQDNFAARVLKQVLKYSADNLVEAFNGVRSSLLEHGAATVRYAAMSIKKDS